MVDQPRTFREPDLVVERLRACERALVVIARTPPISLGEDQVASPPAVHQHNIGRSGA